MRPNALRRAVAAVTTATGLAVLVGLGGATPAGAAVTTTYTNAAAISIPDQGSANPFPSAITVAGAGTQLSGLEVTLNSVAHSCVKDLDILLVAPDGTKTTLMSDVGHAALLPSCADINKTVIVSDAGPSFGTSVPRGNPITVRPSDNDAFGHQGDSWPGVADEVPASNLSTFNGKNPNRQWKLYVVDDSSSDSGSIAGWSLKVTTVNGPPTATNKAIDARKGEAVAVTLGGTDPDGDALTCLPTLGTTPKGVVAGSGCNVAYTAATRSQGGDSFAFRVRDTAGTQSGVGTVTVSIVNRPPTATDTAVSVAAGGSVAVSLTGTDPDPGEGIALTCVPPTLGDTASGKGVVSGSGCNLTYKAMAGSSGTDTFGFSVADGFGGVDSGTVTVAIGPSTLAGCAAGDTQVQRYVCRVYLDMLGRPAEPEGKAYWVNRILSGQPRYEILNSFSRTAEYRDRTVRTVFTEVAGRDATQAERTQWATTLRTQNPDVLRASLYGSAAFLARSGGIDGWAPAMYQLVLRRPATPAEAAAAKQAVTTGGKTRAQVAATVLATPAADTATVQGVYERYLRRTPPGREVSFWVGRLQSGQFETRMVVEIVASAEYYNQA